MGDDIHLKCECFQCGPVYYYKWYTVDNPDSRLNERTIIGIGPHRDEHTKSFSYGLELKNLTANDDGYYVCEVGNEHGIDKIITRVNILDRPIIERFTATSQIMENMIKIHKDEDLKMECIAKGSPTPEIHWHKDGIGITPSENIYTSGSTLTIRKVSENDMGEFSCVASNSLGIASKEVLLYVVVPPTFAPPKDTIITAEEGQIVRIMCDVFAIPFPTIQWRYNNEALDLNDTRYELIGSELTFEVEYKDNGIYKCEASNEAGTAESEIVLIVYVPPTVYPVDDDTVTSRGQKNATLKCKAEGYPIPDVSWTFDGEELTNSSHAFLLKDGDLLLVNVSLSMAGPYICQATNKVGEIQRTSFLTITEPPKVLSMFDSFINVTTETSFSLICAAKGTPRPDIFWAKNGEKYTDGPLQQFLDVTFGKITSGNYTCIAQNPEGADTKTVAISSIEPPRLDDVQAIIRRKINVTEGENLEIKCPFVNIKKVTWYKDDFRYHSEPRNSSSTSLHLPAAALSDRGNYTCIAENEAGSVNFTQQVTVLAPPRVITNDVIERFGDASQIPEITVETGEDLEINCPMEGFPKPTVKWMKDSTIISTQPDLILTNVQPFHDGRYDCEARNTLGSADYSYLVKVLAPPTTHLSRQTWKEAHEGEDLELKCSFLGNPAPKISWEKNNYSLPETDGALHLNNIQPKDKGIYKCTGQNIVGLSEIFYTVDILETPKFTFVNDDINILEQDDMMLRCAARGNPMPILAWTYNGQMVLSSSKIPRAMKKSYGLLELDESGNPVNDINSNDIALSNNSVATTSENNKKLNLYGKVYFDKDSVSLMLVIKNPNRKLPGIYTCHAVNALGTNQKDVKVRISASPKLQGREYEMQPIVNLTLLGGLPLILFCPWYGDPVPIIDWLKNNALIKGDYKEQLSPDGRTLTILVSDSSDSGTYHCRARNDAGFRQKQFNVNILAPPHFRLGNIAENFIDDSPERTLDESPRHVVPGEKIIFNCPVSGNPAPAVFWLETTVGTVNKTEILPETTTQLILKNVAKSAIYTCYANNTLGSIEKRYEVLVVKTPEVIHSYEPQQIVYEHRTISLNCPIVGGTPKPDYIWLKDGQLVHGNSKSVFYSQDKMTLKILNAKKEDSGVYSCRAINLVGRQEKDINVTVITPVLWSEWDPWTPCSQSCGIGTSTRKRRCTRLNGEDATISDPSCPGRNFESKSCELTPCPIDGVWGPWSNWTSCSKSCWDTRDPNKPTMKRYRDCDSPKPAMGGRSCLGNDYEEVPCNTTPCTLNGGWSSWTVWSPCSVSCGSGFQTRYRECNNPVPLNGGQMCIGSALESQVCYAGPCPIHGGWTEWSSWTECSQSCGLGYRKRKRTCTNPEPRYGGLHCLGDNIEVVKCRIRKCENVDLLRNFEEKISSYQPPYEHEPTATHVTRDVSDYLRRDLDESSYEFATGSSSLSTSIDYIDSSKTTKHPPDTDKGTHVVVKVEKLTPIDKDTAQLNFHPGLEPIVVNKVVPCNLGFQLNSNGTCVDIDECSISNPCGSRQFCTNNVGSFSCSCIHGYRFNLQQTVCEDIDECVDSTLKTCSHTCKNIPGSFVCSCPLGQILALDLKNCIKLVSTTNDYQMSDTAARSYEEDCPDGFYKDDRTCQDINECQNSEDDCGVDQTCLNTNGSYLCIPTPCPEGYTRDTISRQCVFMCDPLKRCPEGAKISQTLSYTLLTMNSIKQAEPFLKIVNYDINRVPLPETKFNLETNTDPSLFTLSSTPLRKGIAYLYGSNKVKREKLYNVNVKAYSYDSKNVDLLYVTKFIIYLYVI